MKKRAVSQNLASVCAAIVLTLVLCCLLSLPVSVAVNSGMLSPEAMSMLTLPIWVISSCIGALSIKKSGMKTALLFAAVLCGSRFIVSFLTENAPTDALLYSLCGVAAGTAVSQIRLSRKRRRRAK